LSFFIVHTPPPAFSILSLHDALPISGAYDVTPDSYPILDRVGPEGLFVAVGFSGHGFKLSPEVGRLVAEQVATGRRPEPLEPLRASRFAEGSPIRPDAPFPRRGRRLP